MNVDMIIKMVVAMLGEYLLKPVKAAKYAKWFIRARDYLLLLFPLYIYPEGDYSDTTIGKRDKEDLAVPPDAVKKAAKDNGFNIPFIKGM
jgi:hypothetical protein